MFPQNLSELWELVSSCVNEADADLVEAIRRNDGRDGSREALLGQLDVLEKVRERLHVRFEQFNGTTD